MLDQLSTSTSPRAGARTIAIEGQVDHGTVIALERELAGALDARCTRIVVDLARVTHVPLPALSRLCRVLRGASARGADLTLICGFPHLRRAVELCGLERVEVRAVPVRRTMSLRALAFPTKSR